MSDQGLVPYLPRLLLEWDLPATGPHHRAVQGTMVFVDISGFTAMSERLARRGKEGAEEVAEIINSIFGRLLAVAYENGGSLIKFGGDALLLFFGGPEHPVRACHAAAWMRRRLREIGRVRTSVGLATLKMHVGVNTGSFDFFVVGDVFRDLVVAGPAATTTVAMESAAVAGEIMVSEATAAFLPPGVLGGAREGGRLLLRTPPPPLVSTGDTGPRAADPSPFIPPRLRGYLAGPVDPEHRRAAIAFVRFEGIDPLIEREGAEVVAEQLDELVRVVQAATERNLVTYIDNDAERDGGKFMLVAGAPYTSERDGEQMLRTVRQIVDARTRLPVRTGVNQGRVFAGLIGPPYRRKYSVMGDAVNLAARLMAKADVGQIIAMPSVLDRFARAFETTPLEPFTVKGKAEPVQALDVGPSVRRREAETAEHVPLIGRRAEMERLLAGLEGAAGGSGRLVLVVGEPGLGKSRLVDELRRRAVPYVTLSAGAEQYEASVPYGMFRDLLRQAIGIEVEATPEVAGEQLLGALERLAPHLLPWAPLVAAAVHAQVAATPQATRLDEEFKAQQLRQSVLAVLEVALPSTTLIVIEDGHWLDPASADLLGHLASDIGRHPWLLVVTTRPGDLSLDTEPAAEIIELAPLADSESTELLRASATELSIPPHELAKLGERAGGNPLFLQELIRAVRSGEGIDGLPDTVEAVIGSRIDRLGASERTLLRYASVLGSAFSSDILEVLLDDADTRIADVSTLSGLSDFVFEESPGNWRFRHALIRDVAYEALPYRRRSDLHRRVGDAIERQAGEELDEWAEMLSLHFHRAKDFERAWRYSVTAGQRALDKFAVVQAAEFYRLALDAGKRVRDLDPGEMSRVAEALGDASERIGAYHEAMNAYRTARKLAVTNASAAPRLFLREGVLRLRLGQYGQALRWYTRGLRATADGGSSVRVELGLAYAGVRYYQGKYRECIEWCERIAPEAKAAGDRAGLAHAYSLLYLAHTHLGTEERHSYRGLALPLYEELGDLTGQANVLNNLGIDAYYEGNWADALSLYERSREAQEKAGNVIFAADTVNNIAEILSDQGHLEKAEALFRQSLDTYRAARYAMGEAFAISNLGRLDARAGRLEEARGLLEEALARHRSIGDERNAAEAEARIAEALVFGGYPDEALQLTDATIAAVKRIGGMPVLRALLLRLRGYALAQRGELGEARTSIEHSVEAARSADVAYEVALSLQALGRILELQEDPGAATALAEAAAIFERLGVVSTPSVPLFARAAP